MFCGLGDNYPHNELVVLFRLRTKPRRLNGLERSSFILHGMETEGPDSPVGSPFDKVSLLPWPLAVSFYDPFLMCAKEWVWEGMEEV